METRFCLLHNSTIIQHLVRLQHRHNSCRISFTLRVQTDTVCQGTYTLGRFLAHASILCTVMGADQNVKNPSPTRALGALVYVIVPLRNQRTHCASMIDKIRGCCMS